MTEHPNERVAGELWAAVADANAEHIEHILAPEVVWRAMGRNPLAGEYVGPEGVLDYLARIGELADELSSTLKEIYASDEGAIIHYHVSASRSVKRLEMDVALVLTIREATIVAGVSVPFDQRVNDEFWN